MSHQIISDDERDQNPEKTSDITREFPVISAEEFYGFPGPSEKILKMVTSGNINAFFRHMNSQRQSNQRSGSRTAHGRTHVDRPSVSKRSKDPWQRADLLLHRIVSDKIRKNLQMVENGESIKSYEGTLKMASIIGPEVKKHAESVLFEEEWAKSYERKNANRLFFHFLLPVR